MTARRGAGSPGGGAARARRWAAVGGAVLAAGAAAHAAPGAVAWRSARCRLLPRLSGVGDPGHVALTFDDGPDPASTPATLDVLQRLGWRATFFLLGTEVRRHPDVAAAIAAGGHEVAVHGDRHVSHLRRPATWTVGDVRRARDSVAAATGRTPRWFRPPYGALSASALVAARRSGLQTVLWTTWGRDWRPAATGASVVADVTATFHPGATVLLHDSDLTSAPGSWRAMLEALPVLAERWAAAGLTVGPLAEHGIAAPAHGGSRPARR